MDGNNQLRMEGEANKEKHAKEINDLKDKISSGYENTRALELEVNQLKEALTKDFDNFKSTSVNQTRALEEKIKELKDDNSAHSALPHDWVPSSTRHRTIGNLQVLAPFSIQIWRFLR